MMNIEANLAVALRKELPLWVPWAAPVFWVMLTVLFMAASTLCINAAWRKRDRATLHLHWTERARVRKPYFTLSSALSCLPFATFLLAKYSLGFLSPIPKPAVLIIIWLGGYATHVVLKDLQSEQSFWPKHSRSQKLRAELYGDVLTGGFWVALVLAFAFTEAHGVMAYLPCILACTVYLGFGVRKSAPLALRMGLHQQVEPELEHRVRRVCERVGAPRPQVARAPWLNTYNAIAIYWPTYIVFFGGLEKRLNTAELEAIIAHEAGHLIESPRVRLGKWLTALIILLLPLMYPLLVQSEGRGTLLSASGLCVVLFVAGRFGKQAEVVADQESRSAIPNAPALASALEKLTKENLGVAMSRGGTHPSLVQRMRECGVEPSWPIPRPPSLAKPLVFGLPALLVWVLCISLWHRLPMGSSVNAEVVRSCGNSWSLQALAPTLELDGRIEAAQLAYDLAFVQRPTVQRMSEIAETMVRSRSSLAASWPDRVLTLESKQ